MPQHLLNRTKQFSLNIIRLCESLPKGQSSYVISNQLLRSGTSVGTNYWAACRGISTAEFIAKMGIVVEECDESLFWLELLIEAKILAEEKISDLMNEANEILAMSVSSIKTAKHKAKR